MSSPQINTEVEEYVPEEVKVGNKIMEIISKAVDSNADSSKIATGMLEKIIQSDSISTSALCVGKALVRTALIKSGNATMVFRIFKHLQSSVPESRAFLLERGFLTEIHAQTLKIVDEESLKEVANNTACSGKVILLFAELVHLLSLSISELRQSGGGRMSFTPLSPCIDLCIITSAALRTQLESTKKAASSPPNTKAVVNWGNLIDAFVSGINQALPSFNLLLQLSDFVPTSSASWVSTSCLREPVDLFVLENNPSIIKADSLTVQHLASLLDEVLYLLKFLVVIDNGLPSRWVRSTAMDLLLSASAVAPPTPLSVDPPNDVDEDLNLFDQDDPEVMRDFHNFLQSSGQL